MGRSTNRAEPFARESQGERPRSESCRNRAEEKFNAEEQHRGAASGAIAAC